MEFDNNKDSVKESLINYKDLTYEAFRNVIYKVLKKTSTSGLPGKHHFFISFKTNNIGTSIPETTGLKVFFDCKFLISFFKSNYIILLYIFIIIILRNINRNF